MRGCGSDGALLSLPGGPQRELPGLLREDGLRVTGVVAAEVLRVGLEDRLAESFAVAESVEDAREDELGDAAFVAAADGALVEPGDGGSVEPCDLSYGQEPILPLVSRYQRSSMKGSGTEGGDENEAQVSGAGLQMADCGQLQVSKLWGGGVNILERDQGQVPRVRGVGLQGEHAVVRRLVFCGTRVHRGGEVEAVEGLRLGRYLT